MQTLCECGTAYLITSWVVGTILLIRNWDETLEQNVWMCYFPRFAVVAVVLHILISPFSIPETVWRSWHESDDGG